MLLTSPDPRRPHPQTGRAGHGWRAVRLLALLGLLGALVPSSVYAMLPSDNIAGPLVAGGMTPAPGEPGLQRDGSGRLITNWLITPAGRQSDLWDLPLNAAAAPDGRHLLVANGGTGVQSLQLVDLGTSQVVQTIPYTAPASVFVGVTYSPDGWHAYAAGGGSDVVHTYAVSTNAVLIPTGDVPIGTGKENPFPTGLAVSPDGQSLYVANNLSNTVTIVDTGLQRATGNIPVGHYPYTPLVSADGRRVYVSNWGDGTVTVIDEPGRHVAGTIIVGAHPCAMAFGPGGLLYVADANSDAVSVVDPVGLREIRRISVAPYRNAPLSSSPVGLTFSPDGSTLYVVNAGNNDVAVFGLHGVQGPETLLGHIPTAWYPSAIVAGRDGRSLYVTNAKGWGAGPNAGTFGPNPTRATTPFLDAVSGYADGYCNCTLDNYSGSMIRGTLSTITVPTTGQLRLYSAQVARNNHEADQSLLTRSAGNPIPQPGGTSPIKHVIYIIKENRTYDQVFGDESLGDNAPALTLFPRATTPNLHALAERFGILDNFYADAEVSADGHNWALSANASDYNEKMWPQNYSPGAGRNRGYDFEGGSQINLSPGGYLWDAAAAAHASYRDYGEFYQFDANYPVSRATAIPVGQAGSCTGPVAPSYSGVVITPGMVLCFPPMNINAAVTPNLAGHYDPRFRTYDARYRESDRVAEWQREFTQFVAGGDLPQLELLRLPNDHTSGTRPNSPTPQAFVAENDAAVGQVVDIVSHSPYWASTAIFVTEDDAQNGPDHVDAHRTEALVISPYTARARLRVDHTLYDTAAMVRTMGLIVGMAPLSQYDAAAMPMWRLFNRVPDTTPYSALPATIPITQLNGIHAYGAAASATMDFSQEDRVPMDSLNRILWHAIKGAQVPYPQTPGSGAILAPAGDN